MIKDVTMQALLADGPVNGVDVLEDFWSGFAVICCHKLVDMLLNIGLWIPKQLGQDIGP